MNSISQSSSIIEGLKKDVKLSSIEELKNVAKFKKKKAIVSTIAFGVVALGVVLITFFAYVVPFLTT